MTTADRRTLPGAQQPGGYRQPESQPVLVFMLLSHMHVMDPQAPARLELLGPVSGAPVDLAIVTGDLTGDTGELAERLSGLRVPWLSVYGDHDNQSQATIPADPERRPLSRGEHLDARFSSPGHPRGHGYGTDNLAAETCYYAVDYGTRVRVIVLDTVNPHGGCQGSLDPAQLTWLRFQLARAADRLVVLFSHHPLEAMVNGDAPAGHRRVLADELREVLIEHPCVVLWVNGHTDRPQASPVRRPDGEVGFWQMTTGHVDGPRQPGVVELLEAPDGTITIASTIASDVGVTIPAASRQCGTPRRLPDEAIALSDELLALLDGMEDLPYGGEPVSQRAHALQCATLAVGAGACDELVAAALLHDIGYTPWVQAAAPRRTHERAAATFLLPRLGEHVGWLVGHHVAAKRYLVAIDDAYAATLSDASRRSLRAQDGPASAAEIAGWRAHPWWPQVVLLRGWDDRAKVPGAATLPGSWFRNLLAALAGAL